MDIFDVESAIIHVVPPTGVEPALMQDEQKV